MSKTSTKFFPWSPGVPWQLKNGKYVQPELPVSLLHSKLKEKKLVVCSFGGFLEAYYSLSILEAFNYEIPKIRKFWCGPEDYHCFVEWNGIAKSYNDIQSSDVNRFTTPMFFDKNGRAYINSLYNYIDVKSYYLTPGYTDRSPAIEQIIKNSILPWDDRYLPKLRKLEKPEGLDTFLKMQRINLNNSYILLFPDSVDSIHNESALNWSANDVKAFAAMMKQSNIPVVIVSKNTNRWTYSQAKTVPYRPDFALYLITRAKFILSKDADFLLVSNAVSEAITLSDKINGALDPEKNNKFLGYKNVIYMKEGLMPIESWKFIAGKGCA